MIKEIKCPTCDGTSQSLVCRVCVGTGKIFIHDPECPVSRDLMDQCVRRGQENAYQIELLRDLDSAFNGYALAAYERLRAFIVAKTTESKSLGEPVWPNSERNFVEGMEE